MKEVAGYENKGISNANKGEKPKVVVPTVVPLPQIVPVAPQIVPITTPLTQSSLSSAKSGAVKKPVTPKKFKKKRVGAKWQPAVSAQPIKPV